MKPFKSFLSSRLTEYIAYRKNVGFAEKTMYAPLRSFDRYLFEKKKEPCVLPPSFFLELRADLPVEARSVNRILSNVRGFFNFLVRCGDYETNPMKDIPLLPENEFIPFIFSQKQVDELILVICREIRKDSTYFFKDFSVYMVLLLLARCGMRISEPLRLHRHHYRPLEHALYIEKTKFKKDRLIPIPKAVSMELQNYLKIRDEMVRDQNNPYLLPGEKNRGLDPGRVREVFRKAVMTIGLNRQRKVIGCTNFSAPVVHSLRHSFAVNTLLGVKARNGSPQNALPVLSVYMGHRIYKHTVQYLKMIDAAQREELLNFVCKVKK